MMTSTSSDRAEALHGVVNASATVSADAAPNTVEFALAGLLSCQAITYRFWAAKLDIPLDDVQLNVEGDLNVRGFFGQQDGVRWLVSAMCPAE
ncbi:MAG: OsmC family protein [Pseudonocardiaceae bacterium]